MAVTIPNPNPNPNLAWIEVSRYICE